MSVRANKGEPAAIKGCVEKKSTKLNVYNEERESEPFSTSELIHRLDFGSLSLTALIQGEAWWIERNERGGEV